MGQNKTSNVDSKMCMYSVVLDCVSMCERARLAGRSQMRVWIKERFFGNVMHTRNIYVLSRKIRGLRDSHTTKTWLHIPEERQDHRKTASP